MREKLFGINNALFYGAVGVHYTVLDMHNAVQCYMFAC